MLPVAVLRQVQLARKHAETQGREAIEVAVVEVARIVEGAADHVGGVVADDAARLKGRVETLDDVLPAAARGLGLRLAELADWSDRLDLVERWLLDRLGLTPAPPPWLEWAWRRILTTGGAVPMEQLADELGYTQRHVARVFREAVGLDEPSLEQLVEIDVPRLQLPTLTDGVDLGSLYELAEELARQGVR